MTRVRSIPSAALLRTLLGVALAATLAPVAAPPAAQAAADDGLRSPDPDNYVTTLPGADRFPLVAGGAAATLVVSASDHAGVSRRPRENTSADQSSASAVQPVSTWWAKSSERLAVTRKSRMARSRTARCHSTRRHNGQGYALRSTHR